jgi:hypothetical protein
MQKVLRHLTPEEMRQVALYSGSPVGGAPEEIIRSLARQAGALVWGIFPAGTDDLLLDHVGRRLGMAPLVGGPHAILMRERAILAEYLRRAWNSASEGEQRSVLKRALQAWDNPSVPHPSPVDVLDGAEALRLKLEGMLQSGAGIRALAMALDQDPLRLPSHDPIPGAIRLPNIGRRVTAHQAMYGVLTVLWRARARLLREGKTQHAQLEREIRQIESLVAVRHRNLSTAPRDWKLNPASGLSLVAAGGLSTAVHLALAAAAPVALIPAAVVAGAGVAWSAAALAMRPHPGSDRRIARLNAQIHSLRSRLQAVEHSLLELDAD